MLEQLLEQLWEQEAITASLKVKELAELAPLTEHANTIRQAYKDDLEMSASRIAELKAEILKGMGKDEKTIVLACATLTKRVTRRLVVTDGAAFYNYLDRFAKGILKKVKYSFPGADIIKLVDAEVISLKHLEPMAEIKETQSLVIKKN